MEVPPFPPSPTVQADYVSSVWHIIKVFSSFPCALYKPDESKTDSYKIWSKMAQCFVVFNGGGAGEQEESW